MATITDAELSAIIQGEINRFRSYSGSRVEEDWREAIDMFEGRPLGNEISGRSQFVSQDLTDMVHAIVAQLQPAYTGESIAQFQPEGDQDEEQAQSESIAVNDALFDRSQGFTQIQGAIMDCLLQANGTITVQVVEETDHVTRRFPEMSQADINLVLAESSDEQQIELDSADDTETLFTITRKINRLEISRVSPENWIVDYNQEDLTYERSSFCAERMPETTRSDLLDMGIPKAIVEDLPTFTMATRAVDSARQIDGVEDPNTAPTKDRDKVELFKCYIRLTDDGETGISHLERVLWAEDRVLERSPIDFIPAATGVAFLMPGRWYGQSLFHKLRDIVRGKSQAIRQWIDSNNLGLNPTKVVLEGQVQMDDVLNNQIGAVIRAKSLGAVEWQPTVDIGPSAQLLLDYFDRIKTARSGASVDAMSDESQTLKASVSAQSVDRQLSAREQMSAMIARTISETLIRNLFVITHAVMRRDLDTPVAVQIADQWQQVQPSSWRPRVNVAVVLGVSPGERSQRAGMMGQLLQVQMQLLESGADGIMTSFNHIHRLLVDMGTAAGLPSINRYLIDPESPQAQQAGQQKQQQQQAAQAEQAKQQQQQVEMVQAQLQIEQGKNKNTERADQMEHLAKRLDLQWKYFDSILDASAEADKVNAAIEQARETSPGPTNGTGTPGSGTPA